MFLNFLFLKEVSYIQQVHLYDQKYMSHHPSKISLTCRFGAQETFLLLIIIIHV